MCQVSARPAVCLWPESREKNMKVWIPFDWVRANAFTTLNPDNLFLLSWIRDLRNEGLPPWDRGAASDVIQGEWSRGFQVTVDRSFVPKCTCNGRLAEIEGSWDCNPVELKLWERCILCVTWGAFHWDDIESSSMSRSDRTSRQKFSRWQQRVRYSVSLNLILVELVWQKSTRRNSSLCKWKLLVVWSLLTTAGAF